MRTTLRTILRMAKTVHYALWLHVAMQVSGFVGLSLGALLLSSIISLWIFAASQTVNFFYIQCDVLELKGNTYKIWKERILLQLGWMDIDYAIRKVEPPAITYESSPAAVALYERWN